MLLCICLRQSWRWFLTAWQPGCWELFPGYWICPSCRLSLCCASCLSAALACWHCLSLCSKKHLLKPTTKGAFWIIILGIYCSPVSANRDLLTDFFMIAGKQFGGLVLQHWVVFLACYGSFCSRCVLEIWMRKSCRSSDRSSRCSCSTHRSITSWWPMLLCCKRSYSTSR